MRDLLCRRMVNRIHAEHAAVTPCIARGTPGMMQLQSVGGATASTHLQRGVVVAGVAQVDKARYHPLPRL